MGRVDDFGPEIDGIFCRLAGARRIAREWINHADFDAFGGPCLTYGKHSDMQGDGKHRARLFHHFPRKDWRD
jgi:hypothetical protein